MSFPATPPSPARSPASWPGLPTWAAADQSLVETVAMPASDRIPDGPAASHRALENLITPYAGLVDAGDFAGLGTLLADAPFRGGGPPVSGPDAIRRLFQDMVIRYDDGTPRTKHVTTNIAIDVDEEGGTAASRAYFTVRQG